MHKWRPCIALANEKTTIFTTSLITPIDCCGRHEKGVYIGTDKGSILDVVCTIIRISDGFFANYGGMQPLLCRIRSPHAELPLFTVQPGHDKALNFFLFNHHFCFSTRTYRKRFCLQRSGQATRQSHAHTIAPCSLRCMSSVLSRIGSSLPTVVVHLHRFY